MYVRQGLTSHFRGNLDLLVEVVSLAKSRDMCAHPVMKHTVDVILRNLSLILVFGN